MCKTVIVAEKPSVAKNIAQVVGANIRRDGYFEGTDYYVSFAFWWFIYSVRYVRL